MKRIIGILGVAVLCLLLGVSVDYARESELSLVSSSAPTLIDDVARD